MRRNKRGIVGRGGGESEREREGVREIKEEGGCVVAVGSCGIMFGAHSHPYYN